MIICFVNNKGSNSFTSDYESLDDFSNKNKDIEVCYVFNEDDNTFNIELNDFKCPICGSEIKTGKKNIYCSDYKNGCKFSIPYSICKKRLTRSQIIMLINSKMTNIIKGFISNNDKHFDATLKLTDDGKIEFVFPNKENKEWPL